MGYPDRVAELAARVRWLDRYRRMLAIVAAAIIAPMLISKLAGAIGVASSELHGVGLSVMVGLLAWWIVEVALAWITAVWETECACLVRDQRLPRARVVVGRRAAIR
jgi:hypothetical protein